MFNRLLVYFLGFSKVFTVLFRIISITVPRIWRPTLNYINDTRISAFIEFVQRFSSLNTRSGVCVMSIFF